MEHSIFDSIDKKRSTIAPDIVLQLQDICFSYHSLMGETEVLKDISFSVKEGEFIAIVGPSGCGKSTLLNIICGLLTAKEGKCLLPEKSSVGYMLQHDHLFEWRTIYENVILGLEIQKKMTKENTDYVLSLLESYGLLDFKDKKPSELSGGMKQRAALIRTMALHPQILLLDEPFSALDYQTRLMVSSDIGKLIKKTNKTAILVTHNLSEAISLADRILVLSKRPSTIKKEIQVQLTIPDDSLLGYRKAPEFQDYFNEIWELLIHEKEQK